MSDMQRETLFRSATFQLRDDADGGMPTMSINFARFNEWTEIRDIFEGHFMERFAPGSFKKTISERGDRIKVLFQHGQDPQVGKKPLGSIADIREEKDGAWADVKLLDTDYVRELLPGIKAGLYGASMAFRPTRTEDVESPERSAENPDGIREVTVKEAALREFGPVTFPAYEGTSAAARALTGDLIIERIAREPEAVQQILSRQVSEGQDRLVALAETHGPDIVGAVVSAVNGGIGGRVGLGTTGTTTGANLRLTNHFDTSTKTTDEREAPADEATPAAPRLARVGDQYLPLKNAA